MRHKKKLTRVRILFKKISRRWFLSLNIFLVFAIVIAAAAFFTNNTYHDLNNYVISQRTALSSLSASIIKEKLDKIIAVGAAHVSGETFQGLIESGNWDKALRLDPHMLSEMPYVETANIFTTGGVLVSAIPSEAKLDVYYGTNFSNRDYFKAFSKTWEPYAGELIVPIVSIDHTILLVLIPIKTDAGKVIGVLVLSIGTDSITSWIKEVNAGMNGDVYVVDVKGHLISHPTLLRKRELVDFSSLLPVQKALRGESGVDIGYNSIEKVNQLSSYSPVPGYGWGVVVAQSTDAAFAERNNTVVSIIAIECFIVVMLGVGTYLLLRDRSRFKAQVGREEILLNSIGDSVIAIDRNWRVTLWNNSAKRLAGWSKEEVLGRHLLDRIRLIREMDRGENVQFIEDVISTGRVNDVDYPAILIGKSSKDVIVSSSVAPIINDDKEITGAVIVIRDVTKRREASMLHSDFAYASHQLRTPVTEALWSLETILSENDPNLIKKNVNVARASIQSIKKLSEELITVSEIDQGEVYVDIANVKLLGLMDEVIDEVSKKAEDHSVKIKVSTIGLSDELQTDQKIFKRILVELLDNAIIYSPEKSKIMVDIKNNKKEYLFEINDSGVGIDPEHQPLVFTKFFRGSNFSTSEIAGAGLGLYIVKGYVKLLGGKVWFKSDKDEGTTFYVSIPSQIASTSK